MIDIYRSEAGPFTIVNSKKFYDIMTKLPRNYILADDTGIKDANNIASLIDFSKVFIGTVTVDDIELDASILKNTRAFFKAHYNIKIPFADNTVTYKLTDTKSIVHEYIVGDSNHTLSYNEYWKTGDTQVNKGSFYGLFSKYNVSDETNKSLIANFYIGDESGHYAKCNIITRPPNKNACYIASVSIQRDDVNTAINNFLNGVKPIPVNPDPYNSGGASNTGGGNGTFGGGNTIFGGNSDSIDIPQLPTASASAAGFITLFNPTLGQLNNLASYMWSDLFSLETFKKIFADPMDCILGLSIVPVKPASAGTSTVKIGNVSTDVSMNKTSSQYVAVDCGTIDVKEYWGAYLDYAPYTQCEIYLPYVGTKQISVDDVMNKAVHVVYHVDILSGACNAYVKCGDSVLYTFVGQCSSSIPISGNDWTNVLNGAISVAGKIGLAMATGGATALMSGLGAASSIISSSKPTVERSGAMSSTGGLLGIQKPYLILTRPKQALPENQNKYTGYPSFITMALSDCTGYTEIDSVHLENMSCTDEEAQEIENLLKSGVIF